MKQACSRLAGPGEETVFVIDMASGPAFAFAARTVRAAEAIVRKPWFVLALDEFCTRRQIARDGHVPCPRTATAAEAAAYHERLAEFPEALGHLLVAHLPPPA